MSDLNDLKSFADDVTPIIQDLVKEWIGNQQPPDVATETAAIDKLQNLLAQAMQRTDRTPAQATDALVAVDAALTEILIQAATNASIALPRSKVMIIKEQIVAINDALGQLAEVEALTPLVTLLPKQDLTQISTDLQAARAGIQQKRTAQAILDTVVDVVIIASKVAVKVAAA